MERCAERSRAAYQGPLSTVGAVATPDQAHADALIILVSPGPAAAVVWDLRDGALCRGHVLIVPVQT